MQISRFVTIISITRISLLGIIEDEALDHLALIPVYPIDIHSEADLAREIARLLRADSELAFAAGVLLR